ncbi:MAG: pyridoxal phosphate-dependent aminotransferase [Thermodesulfobacteriota bacterium]|nr:pyridoxal phosphate-dependent aminotransferase [Thermodesulfobacteriota bacterium]
MCLSKRVASSIEKSSWVRKMFEEGAARKAEFGPDNVFDFSLGNPNLDPPVSFKNALKKLASDDPPGVHAYMPNAGFVETREAVSRYLSDTKDLSFGPDDIIMTVGAAGALNVVLKAILNPGEEVVIPAPYFVEYNFYIDNHGGIPKTVSTKPDFSLDLSEIEAAINPRTRAVLINTPNNPTGKIYNESELLELGRILTRYSQEHGNPIYLIADEPYNRIVYNGTICPSVFDAYKETFLVTSFSKDLSLAGERIGYIAVHPQMTEKGTIIGGLILCNRILGFVNAPAFMQRVIQSLLNDSVDIGLYKRKRDTLSKGLKDAGYDFNIPEGAFYLFPRSPVPDDVEFVRALQEENILTVPGSAFGSPGYFRIAYCVEDKTIERALPGFARVMQKYK